jgi:hypothetical protein
MINIEVTGTTSNKIKCETIEACEFYLKKLKISKNRKRLLEIFIEYSKIDEYGLCEFNDDYEFPEFIISINRGLDMDGRLSTLAHEIVHAKQFLRKELKCKNTKLYWKGKLSPQEEWEVEAYKLEDELFNEYKKCK